MVVVRGASRKIKVPSQGKGLAEEEVCAWEYVFFSLLLSVDSLPPRSSVRTREMVKALATKTDSLSSTSRAYVAEEEHRLPHTCCSLGSIHTYNIKKSV